ncbi:HET-domain-containing protein, partial [Lepidopterella palustris CBS 459.81]
MKELAVPLLLGAGLVALDLAFDHKSKKKQEEKNQRLYSDALTLPKHQRPRKYRSHNEIRERHEYYSPKLKRRGEYDGVVESDHEYVDFQPRPPSSTWENSDIYGDNGLGDYAPAQDPGSQIWKSPSHNIRYKQLRRKFVRLLRIPPKSEGAELHCILFHEDLETTTVGYEALSYHWGDSEVRQTIYCYDSANYIKITPNLHSALRRFRDRHVGRILWVDAVCINQGDRNEKSDQIPLMQEIFANARRVLIWLGDAGDEGGLCLNFFRRLDESFRRPADSIPPVIVDRVIGDCLQEVFRHRRLDPLERFFHPVNRPWFLRRWVIQEVAPSPNGLLFCGPHQPIHWDQFSTAVNL